MLASEYIKALQMLIDEHGDTEVLEGDCFAVYGPEFTEKDIITGQRAIILS